MIPMLLFRRIWARLLLPENWYARVLPMLALTRNVAQSSLLPQMPNYTPSLLMPQIYSVLKAITFTTTVSSTITLSRI